MALPTEGRGTVVEGLNETYTRGSTGGMAMSMHQITCWSCGHSWGFNPPMARGESCEKCGWDARVCKNCRFYDARAYRECLEEQAEWVKDKDKRNFCSYFESNGAGSDHKAAEKSNPLDALFGGGNTQNAPKSKLEQELDNFFKK